MMPRVAVGQRRARDQNVRLAKRLKAIPGRQTGIQAECRHLRGLRVAGDPNQPHAEWTEPPRQRQGDIAEPVKTHHVSREHPADRRAEQAERTLECASGAWRNSDSSRKMACSATDSALPPEVGTLAT